MSKEIIAILIFDFLITGIILLLHFFPAKEINYFYGYRTKRSMKNIEKLAICSKTFFKSVGFCSVYGYGYTGTIDFCR